MIPCELGVAKIQVAFEWPWIHFLKNVRKFKGGLLSICWGFFHQMSCM